MGDWALSADAKLLAVLRKGNIEIWDLPAWKQHRVITPCNVREKSPPSFLGVALSDDGKNLATTDSYSRNLLVLDLATDKLIHQLPMNTTDPFSNPLLRLHGESQSLVCSFRMPAPERKSRQMAQSWDLKNRKPIQSFAMSFNTFDNDPPCVISDNARWISHAVTTDGSQDNCLIEIWDLSTGKLARRIETECLIQCSAFSPDGIHFAASDGTILRIYEVSTGKENQNIRRLARREIQHLQFSPDGRSLYVCGSETIDKRDTTTGELLTTYAMPRESVGVVQKLIFPDAGRVLALGMELNAFRLWDVIANKVFSPTDVSTQDIAEVAFTSRGELFIGSVGGGRFIDPRSGSKVRGIPDRDRADRVPNGSGSGRVMALSNKGDILRWRCQFYDAKTGKLVADDTLAFDQEENAFAFLDGDAKVATVRNRKLRIWELHTGRDITSSDLPLPKQERARSLIAAPNSKHFAIVTQASSLPVAEALEPCSGMPNDGPSYVSLKHHTRA